jgi:hypothetical protein
MEVTRHLAQAKLNFSAMGLPGEVHLRYNNKIVISYNENFFQVPPRLQKTPSVITGTLPHYPPQHNNSTTQAVLPRRSKACFKHIANSTSF